MKATDNIIRSDVSLLDALRAINCLSGSRMTLFVTDKDSGRLVGTLTDGDIRRALIAGNTLDKPVTAAMCRSFKSLKQGLIDVEAVQGFRAKGIHMLPVVDETGSIVEIVDLGVMRNILPISAILMAGGKGERLRPLTNTTPKPLLKIDGKAIIDYNIEALAEVGVTDITVTTCYLAEQLHEHFAEPVAGVKVKCFRETTPLGTMGPAANIDLPEQGDTLVMNSDLLTSISFEEMYIHHHTHNADITIAAIPYTVSVPYAILATDIANPDRVVGIEEKPSYSYYANGGIYMIRNSLLCKLPRNTPIDAPDLVAQAIAEGLKVTYFPINGTWIDVGSPTDFRQAAELMRHHRNLNRKS